jgi:hypothetical protein
MTIASDEIARSERVGNLREQSMDALQTKFRAEMLWGDRNRLHVTVESRHCAQNPVPPF